MRPYRDITDEEWEKITPLLPEFQPRKEMRGRPLTNTRAVLNGVLWVIFSGASWAALPRKYPSYQTCHRRFQNWHETGVLKQVIGQLFGASSDVVYASITARMRRAGPPAPAPSAPATLAGVPVLPGMPADRPRLLLERQAADV